MILKFIYLFFIIAFPAINSFSFSLPEIVIYNEKSITNFIIQNSTLTKEEANEIAKYIFLFSQEYVLNPKLITKQMYIESKFDAGAYSHKGARGLMQIKTCWDHLLFRIDDGELGKELQKKKVTNFKKYYYIPKYNIEVGCYIMSNHLAKYGKYELALVAYNYGQNTDFFKRCLKDSKLCFTSEYVKYILSEL